jgi:Dyp-type peroxidase family
MEPLEYDDIQGLVFSGYGNSMAAASYHLLRVDDAARAKEWLRDLVGRVTRAVPRGARPPARQQSFCLNVAVSRSGLERFGLDPGRDLVTFERAFQDGMTTDPRPRILGDQGPSDPVHWAWGNQPSPVDVLLLLFGQSPEALAEREAAEAEAYSGGLSQVVPPVRAVELIGRSRSADHFSREHFGFADGISQPTIREHQGDGPQAVAAGEFLLGYVNEYGRRTAVPYRAAAPGPAVLRTDAAGDGGPAFGHNGTYLVVRQLRQDVAGFWNFLRDRAGGEAEATLLAAKMMGRWPSGAVVRDGQTTDPGGGAENDFTYADTDPHGYGVPIGAHIRRANPRGMGLAAGSDESLEVARRHRILRRGRSYGPRIADRYTDDGADRGLLFVGVNANIERQFEFIQHSWLNNPLFGALYDEVDPVTGDPSRTAHNRIDLTIPARPVRRRVLGIPSFVMVRGGGYYFLPGIRALRTLSA